VSGEASARVLGACIEDFNSRDAACAQRHYSDDVEHAVPALRAVWRGRAEHAAAFRRLWQASPDLRLTVVSTLGDDDQAVAEWVIRGTLEQPLDDLPATGRRFEVRGVSCARLAGGKVRRQVDYWDLPTLLRQLGLLAPLDGRR